MLRSIFISSKVTGGLTDLSLSEEEQEEIAYDVSVAFQKIQLWKERIVRTIHQDTAKKNILEEMKPNQVLIIIDWAMKFLPVSYRETQSEWFGKKGRPSHVCAAIVKKPDDEEFEVRVYYLVALRRRAYFHFCIISLTIIYTAT